MTMQAQTHDEGPWTIPANTPAEDRVVRLNAIAAEGTRDPGVQALGKKIAVIADAASCCDRTAQLRKRADMALAFVQALPWRDNDTVERYQAVTRTLRQGGNCHDRSPVLVALLRVLGIPSAKNAWMHQPESARNHVLVTAQLGPGDAWCWAETTVNGARWCEDPYAAERRVNGPNRAMGKTVPADVVAPAPKGQSVVTAVRLSRVNKPRIMAARPTNHPRVAAKPTAPAGPLGPQTGASNVVSALGDVFARRLGPLHAIQASKVSRTPVLVAGGRSSEARTAPAEARAVGRGNSHAASAGLASDPCDASWRAYAAARDAFGRGPLAFPSTGTFGLRRIGGASMPSPAGQSIAGMSPSQWLATPVTQAAAVLSAALDVWARGAGIDPRSIDGGARYDWLNVATQALYVQTQAQSAEVTSALAAYRACRARGLIDAAAVVHLTGNSCGSWPYTAPELVRAVIRGYLAGNGYAVALDDATVNALAATVTRYCEAQANRTKAITTAPRFARGLLVR